MPNFPTATTPRVRPVGPAARRRARHAVLTCVTLATLMGVAGCATKSRMTAKTNLEVTPLGGAPGSEDAASASPTPQIVYVRDFALDPSAFQATTSPGDRVGGRGGLIGGLRDAKQEITNEVGMGPVSKPEQAVELLSSQLVSELKDQVGAARRLAPDEAVPTAGWLVSGRFASVQGGNAVEQAGVGFGMGSSDVEVVAELRRLSPSGESAVEDLSGNSTNRKTPGAVVTLNPYVAAAKFMMARNSTRDQITALADQIAERVAKVVKGQP